LSWGNKEFDIPIIIPCYRIIGSKGKLIGYARGLELKGRLLGLESELIDIKWGCFNPQSGFTQKI
jgi:methylated-DNA-[protein]-cysteine S-methyltransferase